MKTPSPDDGIDWAALARLLADELPEEQATALRGWIAADPARVELVARLREVWDASGSLGMDPDAELALEQIREIAARQTAAQVIPISRPPSRRAPARTRVPARSAWASAAAVALIALTVTIWRVARPEPAAPVTMIEYVTSKGQRLPMTLEDGSRVVLGVDSRLRRPDNYGASSRDLYLTGEAFFEVTHDAARPFRVHTDAGVAEDLGTRFAVRAYPDEGATEVVVTEGQVALARVSPQASDRRSERNAPRTLLQPGDLGVVDLNGDVRVEHGIDAARRLAWLEGRLVFDDTPLEDVVNELARWYDLDIRVTDAALAATPVTASFQDEPAVQVLMILASAVNARYERDGRIVRLIPRNQRS
jgi:transmembrane sensor